ncbi:hypothetical protein OUZ56_021308 [Daphnia magna]|uniref:THAP-type domain-containing protein n=1 Tax=Daphnia magna TaxID=35525 RepID=A0ABQ9ZH00_9CRUS|nr:hypothetical protein OUZ56_021308 [Daphnia magna]
MVKICAIVGCINKAGNGVSFFCIPKVIQKDTESEQQLQKKRRSLWIKQLKNSISITDHSETGTFKVFLDLWEEPILRVRNSNGVMNSVMIDGLEGQTRPLMSHFSQKQLSRFPDKDYFFKTLILATLLTKLNQISCQRTPNKDESHPDWVRHPNPEEQTAEYGDHMDLETANTHSKNEPVDEHYTSRWGPNQGETHLC